MAHVGREVDHLLDALLSVPDGPEEQLFRAMRHAVLGGGKRLRPFLVVAGADLFEVPAPHSLRVGAAVELLHAYSLVHDDLPCMDDDDLRRGRPTVHRLFDEATAVLAGDALQSLAFEVLAAPATHPNGELRAELVSCLARAAGGHGMVGGQTIDLAAPSLALDAGGVARLQSMKTGALIAFCCEAGAVLGHADRERRHALKAYAHDFGLAFQLADDLLDLEGSTEQTGKAVGKDAAAGKATLVGLLGVEAARQRARLLAAQAVRHLDIFGGKAELLRALSDFAIMRTS
jgi:farnesyl diphosphate synthase